MVEDNEHLLLIKEPYFDDNEFICPYIEENLSGEQKLSLIKFLFDQWDKHNKKTEIKKINWSKIDNNETKDILGFNPTTSVYPSKYACKNERLPDYLIEWIENDTNKIDFLTDLGVWTEKTIIVDLRKFLIGESNDFQNIKTAQETRFNEDETTIFNTFEWLKEKEITLKTPEQFETFKKIVEVINENRSNKEGLLIEKKFDFDELEKNSTEWNETYYLNWKDSSSITIYLNNGEMPKLISLNEINKYIFYRFNDEDYVVNGNKIFINSNTDIKKTLQKVASDDDNNFSFENLWSLFDENSDKAQDTNLKKENENLKLQLARLQKQLAKISDTTMGVAISNDISENDQIEANCEAKEIVREKLEREGFIFTKGIGEYSVIDGVIDRDGKEHPLVVKSYINQDIRLRIGANEWLQLMKPNSMFWVHFGNRKLGVLKLYDLLRKQDKITISFSTENLDIENRLENFAKLLQYFKDIHFDFNSIKPDDYNIANELDNYNFYERESEKDLSADDENLL